MIAVTFGLPAESKDLVSRLQNKRELSSLGPNVVGGQIGSRSITIFHTGVGRRIAEKRLTEFLENQSVEILISSGFAGGVGAEINVGDPFLAENISDPELLAIAKRALHYVQPRTGKLFTSSGIVHSAAQRLRLARERSADAIDMETDAIADACIEREIPMLSLRVISDTVRDPFPVPPAVLFDIEQQRTNIAGLAAYFLIRPARLIPMVRFVRQIRRARENLTTALICLLQSDSLGRIEKK